MPDITKCWGKDCPLKEKCYRYTCDPDEYQAYSDFTSHVRIHKIEKLKIGNRITYTCEYFVKDNG
jgi:hypothetical protein